MSAKPPGGWLKIYPTGGDRRRCSRSHLRCGQRALETFPVGGAQCSGPGVSLGVCYLAGIILVSPAHLLKPYSLSYLRSVGCFSGALFLRSHFSPHFAGKFWHHCPRTGYGATLYMAAIWMKSIARKSLKVPLVLKGLLQSKPNRGFSYLIYHSVSGHLPFELDLPFPIFRRQLEFLARTGQVKGYDEALTTLQSGQKPATDAFILTFDDGYREFYTHVFPLLRDLGLPAILFVTTGFVETGVPYPILSRGCPGIHPVSWDMLGEMVELGLVTVGAHTHTHPNFPKNPQSG